jgi:flavin-dependent dehydrogenase
MKNIKKIGYNHEGRRCGEGYEIKDEWKRWVPEKNSIFNYIINGEVKIGNKTIKVYREPGIAFILNRQEFICQLARKAEKLGAKIQTDDKIKSVHDLYADYIIDASGCPSTIKKELGLKKGIVGVTYQQTLENCNCFNPSVIKVIYLGNMGYYWIFPRDPKKKEVNIGIGFVKDFGFNLRDMIEKIKESQNIKGDVNYTLGGLIPLGLQRPVMYKNILFVGDAGVGAFPLSGEGIYRALLSGDTAGQCIARDYPNRYPHLINKHFIKWDVISRNFWRVNFQLRKINPDLVLKATNTLMRLALKTH